MDMSYIHNSCFDMLPICIRFWSIGMFKMKRENEDTTNIGTNYVCIYD